jgi:hypothetical protein
MRFVALSEICPNREILYRGEGSAFSKLGWKLEKRLLVMRTYLFLSNKYSEPPNTGPSGIRMTIFLDTFWVRLSNGPVLEWSVLQYLSGLFFRLASTVLA